MINRTQIAALSLSAAALVGLAVPEGYRGDAYIPVPGDVPTIGFGDTHGVKMGDRTDPVRALIRLNQHAETFQRQMKACIGDVPMYQHEWDAFVSLAYNVGASAFCRSTLAKKLKAGDYAGACNEINRWVFFQGKPLPGLVKRRAEEAQKCLGR